MAGWPHVRMKGIGMQSKRASWTGIVGSALCFVAACSAPATHEGSAKSESTGTTRAAAGTAFPNDQTTYHYFRSKGFTNFQAAAIVGNLDQESGIDPNISQQNGGPGRGIAQWSAGGRWDSDPGDNVVAFAQQQGKSPYDLQVQLDFIMFELNTFPDYGLAQLKASTNVTDATTDFELGFEGCAIPEQCDRDARVNYANDVLNAYGNDPVDTDAGGPSGDDDDDASAPSEAGSSDSGGTSGDDDDDDDAGSVGSDASTGSGHTKDSGASSTAAPVADAPSSHGCAITATRRAHDGDALVLATIGIAVIAMRRRRQD